MVFVPNGSAESKASAWVANVPAKTIGKTSTAGEKGGDWVHWVGECGFSASIATFFFTPRVAGPVQPLANVTGTVLTAARLFGFFMVHFKATIFKVDLSVADMDRNVYSDFALTLARHPSENDIRSLEMQNNKK